MNDSPIKEYSAPCCSPSVSQKKCPEKIGNVVLMGETEEDIDLRLG